MTVERWGAAHPAARRVLYSALTLGVVGAAIVVLGAPIKWA